MKPAVPRVPGAVRLVTFRGIAVWLHWSWGMVAILELYWRSDAYRTVFWNAAEYVTLFAIVLCHEFGHALACRSVGGKAERILLWPLGGVAYVRPPPRPGALLWSIAAGPLVNVVLVPVTGVAAVVASWMGATGDVQHFFTAVAVMNAGLFVFNVLPVYPLDGGQIVHALLWFVVGREKSLTITAGIGLVAAAAGGVAAVAIRDWWLVVIAGYAGWRSWNGLRVARARSALLAGERHAEWPCPHCGEAPPKGAFWVSTCGQRFDAFATGGRCPGCGESVHMATCVFCGEARRVG